MRQTLYDRRTGRPVRSFEPSPSWLKDQQVTPRRYPGEDYFREHNPAIRKAEEDWEREHTQVSISQSVLLWVGLYLISLALIGLWWLKKWTGL